MRPAPLHTHPTHCAKFAPQRSARQHSAVAHSFAASAVVRAGFRMLVPDHLLPLGEFFAKVGTMLEAARRNGGTLDILELQLYHDAVRPALRRAREHLQDEDYERDQPRRQRRRVEAPPSQSTGSMRAFRALPARQPPPLGFTAALGVQGGRGTEPPHSPPPPPPPMVARRLGTAHRVRSRIRWSDELNFFMMRRAYKK